jgi:hypothetical protein
LPAAQRFAGEFEQYLFVFGFRHFLIH